MWQEAPELVLKHIFSYLEASDLHAVFLTCKLWYRLATEDVIWKQLVQRLWKIKESLPTEKISWRSEYKRLKCHTPTHLSETLLEHSDEVLDVSFSHDGKLFCTTSKDATVKVWELGYPTKVKQNAKMLLLLGWNLTQFSTFNRSDTYLCVCGVQFGGNVEEYFPTSSGRAAVFRLKDFKLIQTMKMEPPQLFADWYDDTTVLGGYVEENQTILHIKAFKVVEKEPFDLQEPDCGQIVYSFETDHHHTMNLLVADLSCQHQSHDKSGDKCKVHEFQDPGSQKIHSTNSSVTNKACSCDKHRKMMIFVCGKHSAFAVHDATDLHQRIHANNAKLQSNSTKKLPNTAKVLKTDNSRTGRSVSNRSNQGQFGRSSHGHQNANRGASVLDKPTHRPSFDKYYISGMKLSPDQRELYFNYRIYHAEEFDDDGYPLIESDITIDKFNLVTKSHTRNLLRGHKASSSYPAWYICLDISQDYIVSGSEDGRAFLWDKNYHCFLGHLSHSDNPEIVVNGTTFCPTDSECVVTGGDDGIIHVWRSKRRLAELKRQQGLVPMDTSCTSCFA